MYVSLADLDRWCDTHQTSQPIAEAIFAAAKDEAHVEAIWMADATDVDYDAILASAWENADPDKTVMYWGDTRELRPTFVTMNQRFTNAPGDDAEGYEYSDFFIDNGFYRATYAKNAQEADSILRATYRGPDVYGIGVAWEVK